MIKINEIYDELNIKPKKISRIKNVIVVENEDNKKYVVKENKKNKEVYDYLVSRNFTYLPKYYNKDNSKYDVTEYIEDTSYPEEQKLQDLIDLVSLLHEKTTFYREIDKDYYEEIYNDIKNNIEYLYNYYTDKITVIESKIFYSPSEYLLACNINIIYKSLEKASIDLESWHKVIENKDKQRVVIIHNNLNLDHYIRNNGEYLISWDKAKFESPIFDLYKLYTKNTKYDFNFFIDRYEKNFKLLDEEKKLLFILMSLPSLIEETEEIKKVVFIRKMILRLEKILKNDFNNTKHNEDIKEKA